MRWQHIEIALQRPAHKGNFTPISMIELQRVSWPPDNRCCSTTTATRIPKHWRRSRNTMAEPGPLGFWQRLEGIHELKKINIDDVRTVRCSCLLTKREDTLLNRGRKSGPADIKSDVRRHVIGSVSQTGTIQMCPHNRYPPHMPYHCYNRARSTDALAASGRTHQQ